MAKLHEYQGKALLREAKIPTPAGEVAETPEAARRIAEQIGGPVAVKGQAWITSRAARGAIAFAETPGEAETEAGRILRLRFDGFGVDRVLVEERLDIEREFYAGVIVDDRVRAPVVVVSRVGGSGIEEIAARDPDCVARHPVSVRAGLGGWEARNLLRGLGIHGRVQAKLAGVLVRLYDLCRRVEARSGEINPLVLTRDGEIMAADCRLTIDDYAVFRHPELGIEIAREFDRPATPLEKIAYRVEEGDYRGTFYFIQMEETTSRGRGQIGFHGAGGGGSMMSMDALLARGFRIANFCDTSGNPPASKVYRAARIIFSQRGIDGYFASGSGVASQEQYHSARGLAKAFLEEGLPVPAVIRLGGNMEARAIEILNEAAGRLDAPLEAYGKETSADTCADRMRALIDDWRGGETRPVPPGRQGDAARPYAFETQTGRIEIDHDLCAACRSKACIEGCVPGILDLRDGCPVLNIDEERARRGGCTECLACELECFFRGEQAVRIDLPIAGLGAYRSAGSD